MMYSCLNTAVVWEQGPDQSVVGEVIHPTNVRGYGSSASGS